MIIQCIQNHDTAPGGLRDRQFDDVDHGDHSQARGTRECTHSMRCPDAGTVQVHAVWTCMKQACACIACTSLHGPRSVRMLRSSVSPTARHATRFACLFLRSTKVPTNTETVLALRGRPVNPDQGRLNLWLCLVLNMLGLTQPLPSPIDHHCLNPEFVQLNV